MPTLYFFKILFKNIVYIIEGDECLCGSVLGWEGSGLEKGERDIVSVIFFPVPAGKEWKGLLLAIKLHKDSGMRKVI